MAQIDLRPNKIIYWAFGAAGIGSIIAIGLSIYISGIPRSFPVFFLRSLAVIGMTFVLTFTIAFKVANIDHKERTSLSFNTDNLPDNIGYCESVKENQYPCETQQNKGKNREVE